MLHISFLYGCGTSSKVENFIQTAENSKIISTNVSTWIEWWYDNSDSLLTDVQAQKEAIVNRWEYKDYTVELVDEAKSKWKRIVIIVYDLTNDNSVKLDKSINTSLWRIPSDVVILKLDYKQARELYQIKEMNSVIYLNKLWEVVHLSDGGIYTIDSLLYYL